MKLYLIRHGRQCSRLCNVDVDLSEEGYRQASLLGERLFREKIQAVYSSSLLRAVETAQAANLYWNVEHFVRPELGEISFGDMEGMSDEEIAAAYKDFKAQQGRMRTCRTRAANALRMWCAGQNLFLWKWSTADTTGLPW